MVPGEESRTSDLRFVPTRGNQYLKLKGVFVHPLLKMRGTSVQGRVALADDAAMQAHGLLKDTDTSIHFRGYGLSADILGARRKKD